MQPLLLPTHKKSWWIDIIFLIVLFGTFFFILAGTKPLFVPDEGRYAEIAREMVSSGNYLTPYLNHIKYFEKPILFYWLSAFAIKIGGLNLWSLRSVNALLALLGCVLTYICTRQLYNRLTGMLAATILGTSTLYFVMAHMISLDLPVSVFLSGSLFGFILAARAHTKQAAHYYLWGASIAAALAVLTKGLIGIVFPGMIVFSWLTLTWEWRLLKQLPILSSLIIFLMIATPWHWLVNQHNPEFFDFYFIKQHFLRYTTLHVGHYQPVWFFIPYLCLGFFPWIVFLPQAISRALSSPWSSRRERANDLFFISWALLIFLFFSFSKSKLIPYILPIFPALAILSARYLQTLISQRQTTSGFKFGLFLFLLLSISLSYFLYRFLQHTNLPDPMQAKHDLLLASATLIVGSVIALLYGFKKQSKQTVIVMSFTMILFLLFVLSALPAMDTRTIKPLAMTMKPLLNPADEVITFNQYYQDLPFYLERRITVLNWRNELSFGMQYQNTQDWMITDAAFWQRWQSSKRIFVVMGNRDYEHFQAQLKKHKAYLLASTLTNVVVSNKKIN